MSKPLSNRDRYWSERDKRDVNKAKRQYNKAFTEEAVQELTKMAENEPLELRASERDGRIYVKCLLCQNDTRYFNVEEKFVEPCPNCNEGAPLELKVGIIRQFLDRLRESGLF